MKFLIGGETYQRVLVSAIWLIAVAVSLPQGLFHEVFEYENGENAIIYQICNTALRENSDHQADYTLDISNRHVDGTIPPSYSVKSRKRYFRWRYINVLFFCCHWLAMSNSCLNPIIYGLYNDRYKREYKRVVMLLRCIKLDDDSDEDRFRNKRESLNNTNNRPNKHHDGISKHIKCNKQQLDGSLAHNKCTAVDL
ncbi:unnamed protein product [Anisakis simplex]|uniref:G_PROTEIN_RECEP_F1_2 domain-containing protein n=1 Tax=Anisakis simplex TaxID=6269 RepID=A0A0M3JVJ0_ANISI|nr:unnamed protein product [Anisakis simplex]